MNTSKSTFIGIVVIVLIVVGVLYYFRIIPNILGGEKNTFQAVFLTNGQVYFGHLSDADSAYPLLRDVYYLQVTQPPQPITAGETQPSNINLVKLGGELHGPTDAMRINRDSVLFIEDMRADSRVVAAIEQLEKGTQK